MKKEKRLPLFWKIYFIVFGIVAIIMAILLIIGYNFMVEYDRVETFPTLNANNYAKTLTQGSYGLLFSDQTNAACVFEKDVYSDVLSEKLAGSTITCNRRNAPTVSADEDKIYKQIRASEKSFLIKADDDDIAYITYKAKPDVGSFGLSGYDFDYVYSVVKGEYSIDIVIPYDATAFLNGVEVGTTWATEIGIPVVYDSNSNLYGESFQNTSGTSYTRYSVSGLFNEPDLTVRDKNGDFMTVKYNADLKAFCTQQDVVYILAPDNFEVSVNGIDITNQDRFILQKDIAFEELSVISEYMSTEVKMIRYIVSGVTPDNVNVVAKNHRGFQTPVYFDIENDYFRVYNCMLEPADKDILLKECGITEDRLINYAKYYSEFIAKDNDRWSTIMPYVMPGSELYKTFDSFWSTLAKHDSFWYEDVEIKDISFYTSDAFSCRVSFIYWIKGFNGDSQATKDYPTDVTFYYVKKGDVWYISDWTLHSQTQE